MEVQGEMERRPGTGKPRPRPVPKPDRVPRIRTPRVVQPGDKPTSPPCAGQGAHAKANGGTEVFLWVGPAGDIDTMPYTGLSTTVIDRSSISVYLNGEVPWISEAYEGHTEDPSKLNEHIAGSIAAAFAAGDASGTRETAFSASANRFFNALELCPTGAVAAQVSYLQRIILNGFHKKA